MAIVFINFFKSASKCGIEKKQVGRFSWHVANKQELGVIYTWLWNKEFFKLQYL